MNNKMMIVLKKYLFWYIVLVFFFLLLNFLAAALPPTHKYQKLMARSARLLVSGTDYYELGQSTMDNFTDAQILNVAYCMKQGNPLSASVRMPWYLARSYPFNSERVYSAKQVIEQGPKGMIRNSHWRYWYGESTVISLLHYFLELKKIYPMIGAVTLFLVMMAGALVYKKYGIVPTIAIFFGAALCNFMVFFQNLFYFPAVWIGLGGLLFFLCFPNRSHESLLFISGMLCAYFDLLTVPVLAFGIPALFVCSEDTLEQIRKCSLTWKNWCYIWIGYPFIWGIGYVLSWGTKMLLGVLMTGDYESLLQQIEKRLNTQGKGVDFSRLEVLSKNFVSMYDSVQIIFWILILFTMVLWIYKLLQLWKKKVSFCCPLFLGYCFLAIMPIIIMLIMANHCFVHHWMTYRGITLSAACLIMSTTAFLPIQKNQENKSLL